VHPPQEISRETLFEAVKNIERGWEDPEYFLNNYFQNKNAGKWCVELGDSSGPEDELIPAYEVGHDDVCQQTRAMAVPQYGYGNLKTRETLQELQDAINSLAISQVGGEEMQNKIREAVAGICDKAAVKTSSSSREVEESTDFDSLNDCRLASQIDSPMGESNVQNEKSGFVQAGVRPPGSNHAAKGTLSALGDPLLSVLNPDLTLSAVGEENPAMECVRSQCLGQELNSPGVAGSLLLATSVDDTSTPTSVDGRHTLEGQQKRMIVINHDSFVGKCDHMANNIPEYEDITEDEVPPPVSSRAQDAGPGPSRPRTSPIPASRTEEPALWLRESATQPAVRVRSTPVSPPLESDTSMSTPTRPTVTPLEDRRSYEPEPDIIPRILFLLGTLWSGEPERYLRVKGTV
jgi:hypothetical protein